MKTYRDDDGRRRHLDCDGFVAEGARRCTRCGNRKAEEKAAAKRAAEADERAAIKEAKGRAAAQWRRNTLARYVAALLATPTGSAARQTYFDNNPISGIFK